METKKFWNIDILGLKAKKITCHQVHNNPIWNNKGSHYLDCTQLEFHRLTEILLHNGGQIELYHRSMYAQDITHINT